MSKVTRREVGIGIASTVVGSSTSATAESAATGLAETYERCDAMDLAALVRRGEVTPVELLEEAIRRTEDVNSQLNCVVLKHYDMARAWASKPLPNGPLTGVPFLLKDLGVQLAGTPTTGGSRSLVGVNAPADNTIVSRYKKAGLVTFGKTNVPEFGMAFTTEPALYGPCGNPWNPEHTPGGSSGGSAAAVAAGIVPAAHGTDGGGSIRVPAAACGVFGFKPTRLLTPRGPGGQLSPSAMSVAHALSRGVRDSALLLDVTKGYEPGAPFDAPGSHRSFLDATVVEPGPLRVAVNLVEPAAALSEDCRDAVLSIASLLEDLGHHVEESAPSIDYEAVNSAQYVLMLCEFSNAMQSLAEFKKTSVDKLGLEPLTLQFVRDGLRYGAADYIRNIHNAYTAGVAMGEWQRNYDVILQPVTTTPAPKLGVLAYQAADSSESFVARFRKYAAYTYLYNLTGQPSASVPVAESEAGLPIGVMLSGRNGDDHRLMSICAQIERARPWFYRRPTIV